MKPNMDLVLNEAAVVLNKEFKVKPILYASFALEKVLGKSFDAHDIDLFIPRVLFRQKNELIAEFKKNGFEYIETEVLTFKKHEIEIEFADKEKWFPICGLRENGIHLVSSSEGQYWMLDADNLLHLYKYLSTLSNRLEDKRKKDLLKIKGLEDYLAINR